jgi:xanthine dehydrogenase YagS FAD-binding subunit
MLPKFAYTRPNTLREALEHLDTDTAEIHAGGTDLLGCLGADIFPVDKLVSVSNIAEMKGIRQRADGGLRIGALSTITEVSEHPMIRDMYPGLSMAAAEVASPQLRNQGTIGGNICQKPRCWYYRGEFKCLRKGGGKCFAIEGRNAYHAVLGSGDICYYVHPSDTAPALTALSATVNVLNPEGGRSIAIDEFFVKPETNVAFETVLEPNDIIVDITLPPPSKTLKSRYRKIRARRSWDFALAGVALALTFEDDIVSGGRIVLSGAAPVPWRSKAAEQALVGKPITEETAQAAAEAAMEYAVPMTENGYKIPLFKGVIREELLALT